MDQLKLAIGSKDLDWNEEMEADVDAIHHQWPSPCP
jgi:hypothetical protein